jgi:hypothetical protein
MIPTRTIPLDAVDGELQRLPELSLEALRAKWLELKGSPLPRFMRRRLMTLAVAHAIQEAAYGGLDRTTQRQLDALVAQIVPSGQKPPPKPNKIKLGTRLIREWQGRTHEVIAVEGGFTWSGARYRSLSVIARRITGSRWNGWVFFGLKRRPSLKTDALAKVPAGVRLASSPGQVRSPDNQQAGLASSGAAAPGIISEDLNG